MVGTFKSLGPEDPNELAGARRDVHWAMQIPAGVGAQLATQPLDRQNCLSFDAERGQLMSQALPGSGARGALRLADLTVVALDKQGAEQGTLALDGNTLDEGMAWLSQQLSELEGTPVKCARPAGIIPFHPVARGGLFMVTDREPFVQLSRWFSSAAAVLGDLARKRAKDAPLTLWPGGPQFSFAFGPDEDKATVHAGFCPGDKVFPAPYFFVKCGDDAARGAYQGPGMWTRTPGQFTGAVLPGAEVVTTTDAGEQEAGVRAFFDAALAAASV